jgi:predicted ferric reductase
LEGKKTSGYLARAKTLLAATTLQPLPRVYGFAITTFSISRIVILTLYTSVTLYLLTLVDAPLLSDHFLDDVAFRAAWVTITQIPLVYLLSAKCGPFDLITSISHDRINWMHRWVGRTILVSATAHVAIMKSSISTTDILKSPDEAMTVVRYGIATYTMLIWIAVSSIIPLRRWSYRLFYINHYVSTVAFLFVAFQHVPTYARPPLYLAAGIVAFDKSLVAYFFTRNNISIGPPVRRFARSRSGRRFIMGYPVRMTTPSASISSLPTQSVDTTTTIRIANIPFTWKPGQHVRLYIPALGRFETHPFTPANCSAVPPPPLPPRKDLENGRTLEQPKQTSEMVLMIKSKSGLTQRLAEYHRTWLARPCPNATEPSDETLTAYIDGPYGVAPTWHKYENLVLVASSTGVSFILSILDHLEQLCFTASPDEIKTRNVKVVWAIRHLDPTFEEVVKQLLGRCGATLRDCGMRFEAEFYTTCSDSKLPEQGEVRYDPFAHLRPQLPRKISDRPALRIRHPDEIYDEWDREQEMEDLGLKYQDAEPSPFVPILDSYDSSQESDSEGDEHSTLVDGEEERQNDDWTNEDPFSDEHAMRNDDAYRPLPAPRIHLSAPESEEKPGCQCALIQHQRRKLNTKERNVEHIVQQHGSRPDVQKLLDKMQITVGAKTMVAVCGNGEVVRGVRCTTARINKDFGMGRRKGRVEVWIEGQG